MADNTGSLSPTLAPSELGIDQASFHNARPGYLIISADIPQQPLCSTCQGLELGVAKFIISNKDANRANHARLASAGGLERPPEKSVGKGVRMGSGIIQTPLITLGEVQRKQDSCRLCGLLFRAVRRYSADKVSDGTMLFLTWEVDGRKIMGGYHHINLTRRIRVRWKRDDRMNQDVYLVFVAPKSLRQTNSDAYAAFGKDTHFLAEDW